MVKPLEGIRVVDLTLAGAGPSCTKLLAEYGAEVIWIEPLTGTSTRKVHKFDFYTAGKRSVTLDLKTDEGMEILRCLIRLADVFVSNYRTRALRKLRLDYESVKEMNSRIIYATLTGFGEEGPEADFPGYDPVAFWAHSGMLRDYAEPGSLLVPPVAVGDLATGQALAGGVCAALFHRERTGESERVFTSLLAEAAYLNHDAVVECQYGEQFPKSRKKPRRALLNTYQCKDGKWITLAVLDKFEQYFFPMLKALGREDLVEDARWCRIEDTMYQNAPEVVEILDEAIAGMTQTEVLTVLESMDIPVTRVYSTEEMIRDPQVRENNYIIPIQASDGREILIPANPIKLADVNSGTVGLGPGPGLAEHSVEVLRELGYDDVTIADFLERRITSDGQG